MSLIFQIPAADTLVPEVKGWSFNKILFFVRSGFVSEIEIIGVTDVRVVRPSETPEIEICGGVLSITKLTVVGPAVFPARSVAETVSEYEPSWVTGNDALNGNWFKVTTFLLESACASVITTEGVTFEFVTCPAVIPLTWIAGAVLSIANWIVRELLCPARSDASTLIK